MAYVTNLTINNAEPQSEHCRVEVKMTFSGSSPINAGDFTILRKSSLDGFSVSEVVSTIISVETLQANTYYYFYDYLVEPGVIYKYTTNTNGGSAQAFIDSTGSFILGSSNKQLNFIYNSEVSDFKEVKKDSIIETIGGTYPFVVRGANLGYKQFGLSGLIVSNMDTNLSISGTDYAYLLSNGASNNSTVNSSYIDKFLTDLNPDKNMNFVLEKFFRRNVLSFLNDGKPKLFKSDTEGMYLGRIMDVNLTPVKESGRVLYSVSFTFIEIGDTTVSNLNSNGLLVQSIYSSPLTTSYDSASNKFWG